MFNFFRKRSDGPQVTDAVFISTAAKYQVMLDEWEKNKSIIYIFWFDD